jgi:elongation factor G
MRRYNVPRIAFVNKLDRSGAEPVSRGQQLREKLGHNAVMIQIPIGLEDKHAGVVDLVKMKAYYFDGDNGEIIREGPIPAELQAQADEYRETMLDAVSDVLRRADGGHARGDGHRGADRRGHPPRAPRAQAVPVMIGSAYKNKAVQLLLDGVWRTCPTRPRSATRPSTSRRTKSRSP